jgi:DNA-binding transcriptional regulator PaaX
MRVVSSGDWVLLAYRLPREPSTPRIALWRALRRLGAGQLADGVVALPADSRTREQLEWLADGVLEAGGEASVWLARPGSAAQERALARRMRDAVEAEYEAVITDARAALAAPVGQRKRTSARLQRELRRIRRRDYFQAGAREPAAAALVELAGSARSVAA